MSTHNMIMLEDYLYNKKKEAQSLQEKTSQKDYFKGQVDMIDELLEEMKKTSTF